MATIPQDAGPDVVAADGTNDVWTEDQSPEDSSDADVWTGDSADTGPACVTARPPIAPTQGDPGGEISLTAAITTVDFGDGSGPDGGVDLGWLGYDLDGLCSTQTSELTCQTPGWATGGNLSDGKDGRDNSVGKLLYKDGQGMLSSSSVNQAIADGELPLGIIRVRDYSGEQDDAKIRVEWYVPAGAIEADGGLRGWLVSERSAIVSTGDAEGVLVTGSKTTDSAAYVTDWTFVARFPDRLPILLRETPVDVLDATLTGRLEHDASSDQWGIRDAQIVGRIRTAGMLGLLPSLMYKILQVKVCTDSMVYPATKQLICSYTDFVASGPFDSSRACDALSVGIAFSTSPGPIVGTAPDVDPRLCPDATDPRQDSCITAPK